MKEITLEFKNKKGQKIAGKAYLPDCDGKFPTVIFSHGFGSNYRDLCHHGEGFADEGIVCIFFDFCGGGLKSLSDGKMTEMTPLTEVDDLTHVLEAAASLPYVDPEKIFLQGESMGGLVSAYVAAHNTDKVKGLILWYPAFVIPDDAKRRIAMGSHDVFGVQISPKYDTDAVSMDLWNEIIKYEGPVHIIHGDADLVVPIIYSEKANHIYSDCNLTVIPGAGHGYNGDDSVKARQISVDFIKNILNENDRQLFLTLHVNCKDCYEVNSDAKTVRQILFDGTAEGDFFNGKILPGGVDTQTQNADGSGTLSARYILDGTDNTGTPCKIYIDNEAIMGSNKTSPKLHTDSKALAFIEDKSLTGVIENTNGLTIKIYMTK